MRLCGFNLGDFVMSVCKGCYSIVKDVTFVVKDAETFFSEFDCFICCFSDRRVLKVAIVVSVSFNVRR